uniref:GDSL esterase/lipase n=1 Tax=Kalanchoe fedtschenkoi TaxID=63787 RepID=A0A7N0RD77_KALFE
MSPPTPTFSGHLLFFLLACYIFQRANAFHNSSSPSPAFAPQFRNPNPPPAHSLPLVPAFFVIGDSSVDCGTNNFLGTLARADRPPYGIDFDTHRPTGRFSNGRIPVDFLALRLGLPFVPSYLGASASSGDLIHGVNYASAGAGIIFSSGSELYPLRVEEIVEEEADPSEATLPKLRR